MILSQSKSNLKLPPASTIRQRYCQVAGHHKIEALTRILEVETYEGVIVFVRTKNRNYGAS